MLENPLFGNKNDRNISNRLFLTLKQIKMEANVLDASTKEAMKKRCEDLFSILLEKPEEELTDIQWVVDCLIEASKNYGQDVGSALFRMRWYEHLLLDLVKIKHNIE